MVEREQPQRSRRAFTSSLTRNTRAVNAAERRESLGKLVIKPGASLSGLQLGMRRVLVVAGEIYSSFGKPLVVTSGTDSEHSIGSLHYYGLALDFRTRFFSVEELSLVEERLNERLGERFRVVVEKDHIHVEARFK